MYVGTAAGFVYALAANGYVRWRADLGHLDHPCNQIPDGWGVTGTPVIDPAARALYAADAFGRLHALDLATGAERSGWPVTLYRDYRRELVWAASLVADGSIYVPTGSYCDQPMEGKVIRVELDSKRVTSWTAVPSALGGGGGIWGWGGLAYGSRNDSLYVVTGNAFEGGSNVGRSFTEQAGYGEHLVQLSPELDVEAASAPPLGGFADVDFVGSPVVADTVRCGEIVAAQAKNGLLFGWNADSVGSGPLWQVKLQPSDPATPLLTQPTYSPRYDSFFVVSSTQAMRVSLGADCSPRVAWASRIGDATLYGSPVVAGDAVWLVIPGPEFSGRPGGLLAFDARTGRLRLRQALGGISLAPPSVVDGAVYFGAMHGLASGRFPVAHGRPATRLPGYSSSVPDGGTWQSREDGVYSSDDGGAHWRRIYPAYAIRVVRLSRLRGVIAVGYPASACNCAVRRLWTRDGGRTWQPLAGLGGAFQGRGDLLYWWQGGALFRYAAGGSRRIASADGTIVAAANVGGGIDALVDRGSKAPQVLLARGDGATAVTLPDPGDGVVVRSIAADGQSVVVRGRDVSAPAAGPDPAVEWRSADGGQTWTGATSTGRGTGIDWRS